MLIVKYTTMRHYLVFLLLLFIPLSMHAEPDTLRIMNKAAQPERTTVSEQSFATEETEDMKATPDSLVRVEITTIHYFTDTLTLIAFTPDSVPQRRVDTIHADSADRRGHYVEAHVGLGYGSLGYGLNGTNSSVAGSFSALMQIQYAYFFHQNWGIGAGLWFTNYTSMAQLGGAYTWNDQIDTDLEQHYNHTATIHRWRERETIHNLGIPISLQFQYHKDSWKAGIFGALGISPSFSVSKRYRVLEGDVSHTGFYPAWGLELQDMHEFREIDYTQEPCAKGSLSTNFQANVFAEFGALIPLTPQIELFLGAYGNVVANDANGSDKQDLGWKDDTFTFMNEYKGAYATTLASASHPFEVGIKVGIHWRYIEPDIHDTVDYFDYFTRHDTIVDLLPRRDTILAERVDTLTRAHIAKAAEEVEKFNKIYFEYDSHRVSEEAQDYLSSIVGVLNEVPDAKIAIDGHASEEGQRLHNERLAYNRAKAVAKFLISKGIEKDRVIVIGHGSLVPNEENLNHELPLDRRVEVKVVQKQSEIE